MARDLDHLDTSLARSAANDGRTTKQFAEEMSITEAQVWKFLYSPNGQSLLDRFEKNNKKAERESGQ